MKRGSWGSWIFFVDFIIRSVDQLQMNLIIHIATRSISRRLIIQLCLWELYILLRDRLLDKPYHTYVLFRELRLFVSEFPSHLYPLLVKDISLLDSVRQRSSGTWDVRTVVAKNALFFLRSKRFLWKVLTYPWTACRFFFCSEKMRVTADTQSSSKK